MTVAPFVVRPKVQAMISRVKTNGRPVWTAAALNALAQDFHSQRQHTTGSLICDPPICDKTDRVMEDTCRILDLAC